MKSPLKVGDSDYRRVEKAKRLAESYIRHGDTLKSLLETLQKSQSNISSNISQQSQSPQQESSYQGTENAYNSLPNILEPERTVAISGFERAKNWQPGMGTILFYSR